MPQKLCVLLPQADAEKLMDKPLRVFRNDEWQCHYQDAIGTAGTGLWIDLNAFAVSDQCRLTPRSVPLSGVGSQACIAPAGGGYTTVVFGVGGQTLVVVAPGADAASGRATAIAKAIVSKLRS